MTADQLKPIVLKEIKLQSLTLDWKYGLKVTASYSLISSLDKVLGWQFVGEHGMKITTSPATQQALEDFVRSYKNDVHTALGLPTE